jgi:hypothetical protein
MGLRGWLERERHRSLRFEEGVVDLERRVRLEVRGGHPLQRCEIGGLMTHFLLMYGIGVGRNLVS